MLVAEMCCGEGKYPSGERVSVIPGGVRVCMCVGMGGQVNNVVVDKKEDMHHYVVVVQNTVLYGNVLYRNLSK